MAKFEMSANQKAMGAIGMVIAFIIVTAVTIYSDVMFIQIMWAVFPPGIMQVGGIIGALATGVSIMTLLLAKSYWFRPGNQLVLAWLFTGVEILVSVANDILAYQISKGTATGVMSAWQMISPATPVISAIGWIILWQVDSSTVLRHKQMEMDEKKEIAEMEYKSQVHEAHMHVKTTHLQQVSEQLNSVINSAPVQQQIATHAQRMVAKVLTDVTGLSAFSAGSLEAPKLVIDSTLASAAAPQIAAAPAQPPRVQRATVQTPASKPEPEKVKNRRAERERRLRETPTYTPPPAPADTTPKTQTHLPGGTDPNLKRRSRKPVK